MDHALIRPHTVTGLSPTRDPARPYTSAAQLYKDIAGKDPVFGHAAALDCDKECRQGASTYVLWQSGFPLVEALSSGDSAEARAPLFAALTGRMASSEFFKPFIIGFGFLHSLRGPFATSGAV